MIPGLRCPLSHDRHPGGMGRHEQRLKERVSAGRFLPQPEVTFIARCPVLKVTSEHQQCSSHLLICNAYTRRTIPPPRSQVPNRRRAPDGLRRFRNPVGRVSRPPGSLRGGTERRALALTLSQHPLKSYLPGLL